MFSVIEEENCSQSQSDMNSVNFDRVISDVEKLEQLQALHQNSKFQHLCSDAIETLQQILDDNQIYDETLKTKCLNVHQKLMKEQERLLESQVYSPCPYTSSELPCCSEHYYTKYMSDLWEASIFVEMKTDLILEAFNQIRISKMVSINENHAQTPHNNSN